MRVVQRNFFITNNLTSKNITDFATHQKYKNYNIHKDTSLKIETPHICTKIWDEFGNCDKYHTLIESITIKSNVCAISG